MTVVSVRTNVVVPAVPPSIFYPNSTGDAVPAGGTSWKLTVDSALFSAGSTADLTVQYQYAGVWVDDAGVGGFTLGPRTDVKTGLTTTLNNLTSSIGSNANPYPDRGRIRVDSCPAGTISSITLEIF